VHASERRVTPNAENYEQAIEYLFSRVNYERLSGNAYTTDDFKLDRMREFLRLLGDPQESIPAVHIAGTKGKGSTAAFTASALTAAGYRTGLFTSPHVTAFEERMAVDGKIPSQAQLADLVRSVAEVVSALDKTPGKMSPTYFEIATAIAWLYFQRQNADVAVLEVGMGGRLDATNVCRPVTTAITTISRDHTKQLGSRLEQIAREKAGIIKPGVPVVCGVLGSEAREAIAAVSAEQGAPLYQRDRDFAGEYTPPRAGESAKVSVKTWRNEYSSLTLPLVGDHQAANAAVAVALLETMNDRGWRVSPEAIATGFGSVRFPGRIEILGRSPTVIVDAAHNWAAAKALIKTLDESFPARRRILLFAATRDKDVAGMLRLLLPRFDSVILTCFQNNPRGVPLDELVRLVQGLGDQPYHTAADAAGAWKLARHLAGPDDLICATGSFFIAAEVRELIVEAADPVARVSDPGVSRRSG